MPAVKSHITLVHTFNLKMEDVYAAVVNFEQFAALHSVIKKVKVVSDLRPTSIEYDVEEELRFLGIVLLKPRYRAKVIELQKWKQVQYESEVTKGIFLRINFYFLQQGIASTIREEIEVSGNKFISIIFLRILKKAHLKTFEKLRTNSRLA